MNRIKLLLWLPLLAVSGIAMAGSFKVQPVRVDLSNSQTTAVLHVSNESDSPTVVQVGIKAWSQSGGKDVFKPTRDVLATPPIFTIPAGGEQVVRVGLMAKPQADHEVTYRIFLTQVPPKPRPDLRGLQFALRISIPVFVSPVTGGGKPIMPNLRWSCQALAADKYSVRVDNTGAAHARIWNVIVAGGAKNGANFKPKTGNGYLLAGTQRQWTFKYKSAAKGCQQFVVSGESGRGEFHVRLGQDQ